MSTNVFIGYSHRNAEPILRKSHGSRVSRYDPRGHTVGICRSHIRGTGVYSWEEVN